jgi:hypothetical protein
MSTRRLAIRPLVANCGPRLFRLKRRLLRRQRRMQLSTRPGEVIGMAVSHCNAGLRRGSVLCATISVGPAAYETHDHVNRRTLCGRGQRKKASATMKMNCQREKHGSPSKRKTACSHWETMLHAFVRHYWRDQAYRGSLPRHSSQMMNSASPLAVLFQWSCDCRPT